jgi:D-alanyl-D-alanine carboxypeptidase
MDVATGHVLEQENATQRWYPASLTKLMTLYLALTALKDHRVTLDTPFVVSARAASMPPSNMGLKPGVEVTLDNALKMMMVHSANDLAIMLAEGLGGSVELFADQMNATAARLGMTDSHFANPNGLPNPNHYSSARDLAIIARALYTDFPEYAGYYGIGAVKLGKSVIPTHNNIMGRYPGVEGMKTGYTCAAGFNVVVSDVRGGRRLLAVVLGSPSVKARTIKAGELLDAAFDGGFPDRNIPINDLKDVDSSPPPDMHAAVCGKRRVAGAADEMPPMPATPTGTAVDLAPAAAEMYAIAPPRFTPEPVFVGPKPDWKGPVAAGADAPPPLPVSAYNFINTGEADPNAPKPTRRPPHRHRAHIRRASVVNGAHAAASIEKKKRTAARSTDDR